MNKDTEFADYLLQLADDTEEDRPETATDIREAATIIKRLLSVQCDLKAALRFIASRPTEALIAKEALSKG